MVLSCEHRLPSHPPIDTNRALRQRPSARLPKHVLVATPFGPCPDDLLPRWLRPPPDNLLLALRFCSIARNQFLFPRDKRSGRPEPATPPQYGVCILLFPMRPGPEVGAKRRGA